MRTATQRLVIRGVGVLAAILLLSGIGGDLRRATANDGSDPASLFSSLGAAMSERRSEDARLRAIEEMQAELERSNAIIEYSASYQIPADLAAAIYDISIEERLDPDLAFRVVRAESGFVQTAKSRVGALGLTQIMPGTARFYESGLTYEQLFDRDTNLRIGFRYLYDLLERYDGDLRMALLAYNRGPSRVRELIGLGIDPANGYAAGILDGYMN